MSNPRTWATRSGGIHYGRFNLAVLRDAEDQQSRMVLKQDVEDDLEDSVRLENEDGQEIQGAENTSGKVQKAFSRRRGFTKKRKNERRKALVEGATADYD